METTTRRSFLVGAGMTAAASRFRPERRWAQPFKCLPICSR